MARELLSITFSRERKSIASHSLYLHSSLFSKSILFDVFLPFSQSLFVPWNRIRSLRSLGLVFCLCLSFLLHILFSISLLSFSFPLIIISELRSSFDFDIYFVLVICLFTSFIYLLSLIKVIFCLDFWIDILSKTYCLALIFDKYNSARLLSLFRFYFCEAVLKPK